MSEVSYDLHKAKLAWMSAYGSRETKQTCMRDFLYGYTAEMVLRPTGREGGVGFLRLPWFVPSVCDVLVI